MPKSKGRNKEVWAVGVKKINDKVHALQTAVKELESKITGQEQEVRGFGAGSIRAFGRRVALNSQSLNALLSKEREEVEEIETMAHKEELVEAAQKKKAAVAAEMAEDTEEMKAATEEGEHNEELAQKDAEGL